MSTDHHAPETPEPGSGRSRLKTAVAIRTQAKKWGRRAETWDRHNDAGMAKVAAAAIERCRLREGMDCVDLGCGTGRLALVLAQAGANVLGVDVSPAMIEKMEARARAEGLTTVRGVATPIERLSLPPESVDLVTTNYALHHLVDDDKAKVVAAAFEWLRPGGQLVIADMMFGRGATTRDREIIASKVRSMAKRGLPGYWRILKNVGRFMLRLHERPISTDAWVRLYEGAGFSDVAVSVVVAEAAVVSGVKPGPAQS